MHIPGCSPPTIHAVVIACRQKRFLVNQVRGHHRLVLLGRDGYLEVGCALLAVTAADGVSGLALLAARRPALIRFHLQLVHCVAV